MLEQRRISRNISIAGNVKVVGICRALQKRGWWTGIYSPGTVAERAGRYHPKYQEALKGTRLPPINYWYGATIDNRIFRLFIEIWSLFRIFPKLLRKYNVSNVIIYNISILTIFGAFFALAYGCAVILEYEDSVLASRSQHPQLWKKSYRFYEILCSRLIKGIFAPSPELLSAVACKNTKYIPGVISEDLLMVVKSNTEKKKRKAMDQRSPIKMVYSGGLDESKGISRFLIAIEHINYPLEIHICGKGPLELPLREQAKTSRHKVIFHGFLSREMLLELQVSCHIGLNPHLTTIHNGGSFPFKVVEYLAACGAAFCSLSGEIPSELRKHLFLYNGDSVTNIRDGLKRFLSESDYWFNSSNIHQKFAIEEYGPESIGLKLEKLLTNAYL